MSRGAAGVLTAASLLAGCLWPSIGRTADTPAAAAPPAAAAQPAGKGSPSEILARAIARSTLGLPGGLTTAIWADLEKGKKGTRVGTRYLTDQQVTYTSYKDFYEKFSRETKDPNIAKSRVLLIIGHAGYGLGLQVAVEESRDLEALRVPSNITYDRDFAPLEFVAFSRMRQDFGDKYDLIVLGQCNPRACLRFAETGIPVNPELFEQIDRLSDRPQQLTIIRNPDENIYLVGKRVVHREAYTPPHAGGPLPWIVAPDQIGEQSVSSNKSRGSMTDVFILAGRWTDKPTSEKGEGVMRPTPEMIQEADRLVGVMIAEERRAATAGAIPQPAAARPPMP